MATIVAKKWTGGTVDSGSTFQYVADIYPDSGATPFRTVLHEPKLHSFRGPGEGASVRVEANVKKEKAKFDLSDPAYSVKHAFDGEKNHFADAKAGAVGTAAAPDDPLNGEDPRLFLIRMRIQKMTAQGDTAEIARLQEMIRQIEAGELPMPTGPAAPAAADPIERLTKLASLHASGALTDAEFVEQKAKLLSET